MCPSPSTPAEPLGRSTTTAERASALAAAFEAELGVRAEGVWSAPGRLNLIGEHTDYNGGLALPLGIEQRVFCAVRRRTDERLRLISREAGRRELWLSSCGPGDVQGWAAYVAGVVWALAQDGASPTGLDVLIESDIPMGAGLSSSAALECASVTAMAELWGHGRGPLALARLAQRAEVEVAGMPCGLMDQLSSMCAREGHALAIDFQSLSVEPVALDLASAGLALLVVDTRAPHALVEGAYAERRRACTDAARLLRVASLREARPEALADLDREPVLQRRARHVLTENARVQASLGLLRAALEPEHAGCLASLGPLLSASHASLRDDFEVTVPHLDVATQAAERAGALGARMVGAGFGGSVLALVSTENSPEVASAVASAYATRGWQAPRFFETRPGGGAARVW
jgi:galactokinase